MSNNILNIKDLNIETVKFSELWTKIVNTVEKFEYAFLDELIIDYNSQGCIIHFTLYIYTNINDEHHNYFLAYTPQSKSFYVQNNDIDDRPFEHEIKRSCKEEFNFLDNYISSLDLYPPNKEDKYSLQYQGQIKMGIRNAKHFNISKGENSNIDIPYEGRIIGVSTWKKISERKSGTDNSYYYVVNGKKY